MEIGFLILTDHSEALNGKLYAMGGGWNMLRFHAAAGPAPVRDRLRHRRRLGRDQRAAHDRPRDPGPRRRAARRRALVRDRDRTPAGLGRGPDPAARDLARSHDRVLDRRPARGGDAPRRARDRPQPLLRRRRARDRGGFVERSLGAPVRFPRPRDRRRPASARAARPRTGRRRCRLRRSPRSGSGRARRRA